MSAIIGPNIGGGSRFRFRSRSSRSRSLDSCRSTSPPPRGRAPFEMAPRQAKQQPPQATVDDFWAKFTTKTPGKAMTAMPQTHQLVDRVASDKDQDPAAGPATQTTTASYDEAAATCRAKVAKIVEQCRRVNKKYRDPHFDVESDLKLGRRDCLQSLANARAPEAKVPGADLRPRSAKRVPDIFDSPQFFVDGPTADDVRQGRDGDCWLMAALCTLSNKPGLIERLCVARDPDVGVYGFVFYRDGEWISEIVDDFLYLTKSDYDESYTDRVLFDELERVNPDEAYRRVYQSNSGALYFAQCEHPQETWLPLLEKGYAKAHGDFAAIEGGFGGEGIEDLTGGVTSEIFTTDILDKEYFWKEELLKVNQDFLFGCTTGVWGESRWGERKGILELHSYSVQRAVEIDGKRLVRLRNPWGKGEWKGPWSDGSKEWTPQWLEKLGHWFGDDGEFWIAYEDLLRKYQAFERTRLFGEGWSVTQAWTTLSVPWMLDYHDTYFSLSVSKPGSVVIVLSQLDERYFRGLEGQYRFELALRLHKAGREDYIVRSQAPYRMRRSVNVELGLQTGEYDVRVKIDATRFQDILPIEQVIRNSAKERREKLMRIGLAYDLAHGKAKVVETAEEKAAREAHEKRAKDKMRQEARQKILADREQEYYLKKKQYERSKERQRRARERRRAGRAAKEAEHEAGARTKDRLDGHVDGRKHASGAKTEPPQKAPGDPKPAMVESQASTAPKRSVAVVKTAAEGRDAEGRDAEGRDGKGRDAADSDVLCESDSEFDYDGLDSLSELSERELDIKADLHLAQQQRRRQRQQQQAAPAAETASAEADEPDEFERDPWNAVAVVGLRVFHKLPADAVALRVVRPSPYVDDEDERSRRLDVDDSAKDATLVGGVAERRRSIVGSAAR